MDSKRRRFTSTPIGVQERERLGTSLTRMKQMLFGRRFAESQSLFKRDLLGHFGCVNAIEFSNDGEFIASGGDDRRLLLWNIGQTIFDDKAPDVIETLHISNINSCCFDADNRKVSTGGNDGQVIVHDINVRQSTSVYGLTDAVYCLSPDPVNATIIATATDDGKAQILDLRMSIDTSPFILADLSSAMHSIMFNPAEPRLLATANSKHGVGLWDIRMPLKCIHYKSSVQNCMSVRFNSRGDQLLALRRRSSPVLYDISKMHPIHEFDYTTYYNACTLKSCSFAGLKDEYVVSGSDDFCIYLWQVPTDISETYTQSEPHMILKGHRSIVNQVRYCPYNQVIMSSGVEKHIKMWSPYYIPGCTGSLVHGRRYGDDEEAERNAYSHEEYIHMVLQAGSFLSHDYTNGSTEEEPCMIAFFDSLIQREIEQNIQGEGDEGQDSSDDSTSSVDDDGGSRAVGAGNGPSNQQRSNGAEVSQVARNTRDSTSGPLEESSRPVYLDMESSSGSEGEVDIILSAMYSRYTAARERAMSSGFTPSGKKISSVIAKGKQKDCPHKRIARGSRKVQGIHKNLQHSSGHFLREDTANMNILADVIDNFVDNLVARESGNSHTLSDTNDGHLSTDSASNLRDSWSTPLDVARDSWSTPLDVARDSWSTPLDVARDSWSTPLDVTRETITLHMDGSPSTMSQPSLQDSADCSVHNMPASLEPGVYFMPELQAFDQESFNAAVSLQPPADPSWSDRLSRSGHDRLASNLSQSLHGQRNLTSLGSSLEVVHYGASNSSTLNGSCNLSSAACNGVLHNSPCYTVGSNTSLNDSSALHTVSAGLLDSATTGRIGPQTTAEPDSSHSHHRTDSRHSHHGTDNSHSHHGTDNSHSHRDADNSHSHRDADNSHSHHRTDNSHSHRGADSRYSHHDADNSHSHHGADNSLSHRGADNSHRHRGPDNSLSHRGADSRHSHYDADNSHGHRGADNNHRHRGADNNHSHHGTDNSHSNKNCSPAPLSLRGDDHLTKPDPLVKRASRRSETWSCNSSSVSRGSDFGPGHMTTPVDSHTPASVQFNKVKVTGRKFRVRRTQSRSSSSEDDK